MATNVIINACSDTQFKKNFEIERNISTNSVSSNSNDNEQKNDDFMDHENDEIEIKPCALVEIPRINTKGLQLQRPQSPTKEFYQFGYLFNGSASKRETNKNLPKIKNPELEEGVKKAKKFALEQSARYVLVKHQQQQQKNQLDLIRKQQALVLMCRIYIGNIYYEVNEQQLRTAFSCYGPIKQITMSWDTATNKHKGFAFVEFENAEAAQLALEQMNGAFLGGRNIKVGRPTNMPQAQPIIDQLTDEAKNYNRIYVASIHSELSEQDVQSVFEAFGPIKTASLTRDPQTGKHKGFGFIEYTTTQAAQDAILSMNMFDLGGQLLRVGKAVTPPSDVINVQQQIPPNQLPAATASAIAAAQLQSYHDFSSMQAVNLNAQHVANSSVPAATPKTVQQPTQISPSQQAKTEPKNSSINAAANASAIASTLSISKQSFELTDSQKQILGMTSVDDPAASLETQVELTVKGKDQRLMLMQKLMRKDESNVLILRNMVGPEDVDDELHNEITDECSRYGQVEQVVIYKEKQEEYENSETIVKIFVEYNSSKEVDNAIKALNGRYFAGRVVKAEIYDQATYDAKDYSG